ncbi:hypothetical protein [uncultured Muriicola sp.]|uniref:hypothetical protein n=1 Tax=uncultured Muriicola sp. TaxID=1583102 RepID=UPI0026075655|nr:hypothetical protein [uncultured Muriicola sp.]
MKTIFKLVLMAVLVLTYSCDKETAGDPADELTAVELKGGKDVERPISITLAGADDPDGGLATYTGKMKHLGKIYGTVAPSNFIPDADIPGVFNLSTIGQCGDLQIPELLDVIPELLDVINAANGDQIFSRGEFTFVFVSDTSATYSGTIYFCGGTGRFEGASGFMEIADGVYNITGPSKFDPEVFVGEFSHTGNGMITY